MYLSRLILNLRNRGVQRDLAHVHSMHRTLMRAFADDLDQAQERVLYRIDQNRRGDTYCLVQSWQRPDWQHLAENGYLLESEEDNPAVKTVDLQVRAGQQYNFRLRANPTKRLGKSAQYDKGKRVGLYKIEEQLQWLQRKAGQHGFGIHSVMPIQPQQIHTRIPQHGGGARQETVPHDAKFFSVQFDGMLQVTDSQSFLEAIHNGIGSGKAFGFGLLSLAPVSAMD